MKKNSIQQCLAAIEAKDKKIDALHAASEAVKNKHQRNAAAELEKIKANLDAEQKIKAKVSDAIVRRDELAETIRLGEIQREQQEVYQADFERLITAQFGIGFLDRNPNAAIFWQMLENQPCARVAPDVLARLLPWLEAKKKELQTIDDEIATYADELAK